MVEGPEKERRAARRTADTIERLVLTASEAGVFHREGGSGEEDGGPGEILDLIRDGRRMTRDPDRDVDEAVRTIREAEVRLHEATMQRSVWWRLGRLHRFDLFLYQAAIFVLLLYLGLGARWIVGEDFPMLVRLPDELAIWGVPIAAAGFGAMGAVLRSMWWLFKKVATGEYYARFLISHVCAPWIGAVLGMLIYLVIEGGLLTLGAEADPDSPVPYALALIAGFSWDSAIALMVRIGKRMGSGKPVVAATTPPQAPPEAEDVRETEAGHEAEEIEEADQTEEIDGEATTEDEPALPDHDESGP